MSSLAHVLLSCLGTYVGERKVELSLNVHVLGDFAGLVQYLLPYVSNSYLICLNFVFLLFVVLPYEACGFTNLPMFIKIFVHVKVLRLMQSNPNSELE